MSAATRTAVSNGARRTQFNVVTSIEGYRRLMIVPDKGVFKNAAGEVLSGP